MVNFDIESVKDEASFIDGHLRYSDREYSFDFAARPGQRPGFGAGIVLVDTLQIAIDLDSERAVCVFGLRPRSRWIVRPLGTPISFKGMAVFRPANGEKLLSGVGFSYRGAEKWATYYDPETGWVCIGSPKMRGGVMIAGDTILGVRKSQLESIWLRPTFED